MPLQSVPGNLKLPLMRVTAQGVLNRGEPGTGRAISHFPSLTVFPDSSLIVAYCVGSAKDSPDEHIELRSSTNLGETWSEPRAPFATTVEGVRGSLRAAHLTPITPDLVLAAALWIDRQSYPGKPLFNPRTEGCLPMRILIAESVDRGKTWTPWRTVDVPEDIGPPSLTSPILRLPSANLALSIESNKHYEDSSRWYQKVTYLYSDDQGRNWGRPTLICGDSTGRFFHWDQRAAVTPDGAVLTLTWMYDSETATYGNFERRFSYDEGKTWSQAEDLGVRDQPSVPAVLPDGRVVVAWVDRYHTQSIRARMALRADGPLLQSSELVLWDQKQDSRGKFEDTKTALADMGTWSYGLPFAQALVNGEVMVVYYAGDRSGTDVRWARLTLSD